MSAKQSSWPRNPVDYRIWRLMHECESVHCTRHVMSATPAHQWHMGKHITKCRSCWSMEKVVVWMYEGKRTSLWTSELKGIFSEPTHDTTGSSAPPTVYRGKHIVSRPFHCSYLKANKISKSEGIKKVEYACHFWKCTDAVYYKLSKLVHVGWNYSLPKLARFWDTVKISPEHCGLSEELPARATELLFVPDLRWTSVDYQRNYRLEILNFSLCQTWDGHLWTIRGTTG